MPGHARCLIVRILHGLGPHEFPVPGVHEARAVAGGEHVEVFRPTVSINHNPVVRVESRPLREPGIRYDAYSDDDQVRPLHHDRRDPDVAVNCRYGRTPCTCTPSSRCN